MDGNPLPVQQILANHDLLIWESFFGHFHLWRLVSRMMMLPIPQLERIIPFTVSLWIAIKG
jgi:hypothetical protein